MSNTFTDLYSVYKDNMSALSKDNDFYDYMHEAITSGNNSFSLYHRFFEKKIDLRWVDAIESCIIPLDNIIRNPRKFIVQEEEIVAIERARKITSESVRHLAQHTNLIARVEEDTVTPHHILNVFREESFEIYENRFIFTLIKQLEWFIQERYNVLFNLAEDENMNSLKMESKVQKGNELLTFKMEIATQSAGDIASKNDGTHSVFDRIIRIKTVIDEFAHSKFMKEMHNCTPVRPPIMRTNVILKNPDFRSCLALWQFIQSYDEVGYEINVKEFDEMVNDEYREDLYTMFTNNYLLLKKNSGDVVILCGDAPFMDCKTVSDSYKLHDEKGAYATVISAKLPDPTGYGRIVRNKDGSLNSIVEQKDADEETLKINEVNSGGYWFDTAGLLSVLDKITSNNKAKEYYLPDALSLLLSDGKTIEAYISKNEDAVLGANDPQQLEELNDLAIKKGYK